MPNALPKWVDKPIQVRVRIRAKTSGRLNRVAENAKSLAADPNLVASLLRQAVVETVLVQYRERFLARLPEAVLTERESAGPAVRRSAAVQAKRRRLRARLQDAYLSEDANRIREAQSAYSEELRLYRRTKKSLPRGRFRSLAFRVMRLVADVSAIRTIQADTQGIRLGIGSRLALNAIETPSATPKLTGRATKSPHRTLWKHLEFGTGVYRTGTRRKTRFGIANGGWFYGESEAYGLRLRGSRGVHALWDKEGRPYPEDQHALAARFRRVFEQALFGR